MSLKYFYYKEDIYISTHIKRINALLSLSNVDEVMYIEENDLPEFVKCHKIRKLILVGGQKELPPTLYFVRTYKGMCIRISNDFKYGVIGDNYYPVVRYANDENLTASSIDFKNNALLMIDRPLHYHLEAFLSRCILKQYYRIDIWDGNDTDGSKYFGKSYDLVIHYGHCDNNYFIFGKTKLSTLPQANIFLSHGCRSIQLLLRKTQPIKAFCGFSYYCDGQTPARGSNELLMDTLYKLLKPGTLLSDALDKAKKAYIQDNIKQNLTKSILSAHSEKELVDIATVIACGLISDSHLCILKQKVSEMPFTVGEVHAIPKYQRTILVIVSSNSKIGSICIFDKYGGVRNINLSHIMRYSEMEVFYPDIIYGVNKKIYILLNGEYTHIKTDVNSFVQYLFD